MFNQEIDYPIAIASYDSEGLSEAINWCVEGMQKEDTLTVWTKLKSNLSNNVELENLVNRHSNVIHITGRGGGAVRHNGVVLMAWPDLEDIGEIQRYSDGIKRLCVITWNPDNLRPWVTAVQPTILGDPSEWDTRTPELDPVVVEAMKSLTLSINHNNTIAAGFEKDQVVSTLLMLHKAGITLDGEAMQGWALAHGWHGKNPVQLTKYVADINNGKRPRSRSVVRPDYIDYLRKRAAGEIAD